MTQENKHTRGPWVAKIDERHNGHCGISIVSESQDYSIATVYLDEINTRWGDQLATKRHENVKAVANANLIAAAPELLEALEEAKEELEAIEKNCGILIVLERIESAIAKAKGGAS